MTFIKESHLVIFIGFYKLPFIIYFLEHLELSFIR